MIYQEYAELIESLIQAIDRQSAAIERNTDVIAAAVVYGREPESAALTVEYIRRQFHTQHKGH